MAITGYGDSEQETPLRMVVSMLDRIGELHGIAMKEASEAEFRFQQATRRRDELQELGKALSEVRGRLDRHAEARAADEPQARSW